MRSLLILAVALLSLASCQKDSDALREREQEGRFVAGQLIVVMQPGTTLEATTSLFNTHSLGLLRLSGFHYTAPHPADHIRSVVAGKPYFVPTGWVTVKDGPTAGTSTIIPVFIGFSSAHQQDWAQTKASLQATETETPNTMKWALVQVPVGAEQQWIQTLKSHEAVKSAELNQIVSIN
jgi:hypothetical protein